MATKLYPDLSYYPWGGGGTDKRGRQVRGGDMQAGGRKHSLGERKDTGGRKETCVLWADSILVGRKENMGRENDQANIA